MSAALSVWSTSQRGVRGAVLSLVGEGRRRTAGHLDGTVDPVRSAIGYRDPDFPANRLHIGREPTGENVVFVERTRMERGGRS